MSTVLTMLGTPVYVFTCMSSCSNLVLPGQGPARATVCDFKLLGIFNVCNVHSCSLRLLPLPEKMRHSIHYPGISQGWGGGGGSVLD